jgi:hypothetical protein
LRQDFMPSIALHAIQAARVNSDDGALHINKVVFTQ